jgi:D-alanyl-lipoteichoic acid acyltransferase DltB (MBOAT superfamily)
MLFTSYEFVFVFLPVVLVAVLGASALGHRGLAKLLLLTASLVFYAWWSPRYVVLLVGILVFNFVVGTWLIHTCGDLARARRRALVLVFGLAANIGMLVYFKYTNFLLGAVGEVIGRDLSIGQIVLPLGISFITFQKIAFLVDAYGGQIKRLGFIEYALFVAFFPQLISGPIVHHREVIPQFEDDTTLRYARRIIPVAIAFLVMGAAKKVLIADYFSWHAGVSFDAAAAGSHQGVVGAWLGALAYTVQIYFDFSGYSDMAIGLGLLFGIRLPFNFNSPLKATSIIDFWSRWHMTLSRFLTAYIYNPIVLRKTRRLMARGMKVVVKGVMPPGAFLTVLALPTIGTMLIAGAWHGAGFQFIVFGLFHGVYLVVNHAWRNLRHATGRSPTSTTRWGVIVARGLTFVAFVISIPFFRADSVHTGALFLSDMLGFHGLHGHGDPVGRVFLWKLAAALLVTQILPNTQEIMRARLDSVTGPLAKHAGAGNTSESWSWPNISWRPTLGWAVVLGVLAIYVVLHMAEPTAFLYFQF